MGQSPCSAFTASCASPSTKAPSLHRHYPASTVPWAYPTSHTARPGPHGLPVRGHTPRPHGISRVASCVPWYTCRRLYPGGCPDPATFSRNRAWVWRTGSLPRISGGRGGGRLPRSSFRGLHDVYGYYGLHPWPVPVGLSAPEASAVLLPPLTAPIPSGWNVFACRAGVTPAETQRLFTAHEN